MAQKVLVGNGDLVEIRYPTPSTWNTKVTVQVQIGTGVDPTDVTFGTRIPDATIDPISFDNNQGRISTSSTTYQTIFEKNTFYYSKEITIEGIEIVVPAVIQTSISGPTPNKTLTSNASQAAFKVNNSGDWVTSANIKNGDKIIFRIKTEDWYCKTTTINFIVGDQTWGTNIGRPSTVVSHSWSITTRAQKQTVDPYTLPDEVDARYAFFNSWKTRSVQIKNIDEDTLLTVSATGDGQVSKDNINWYTLGTTNHVNAPNDGSIVYSGLLKNVVLNDTLYFRIFTKDYAKKSTSKFDAYVIEQEYATVNNIYRENNVAGTYNTVVQIKGTQKNDWQVWTEVDRYPDPISLSPIYTYSETGQKVIVSNRHIFNNAEVSTYYYAEFIVSGLGVEYASLDPNTINDPEPKPMYWDVGPAVDLGGEKNPPFITEFVNGRDVEIQCRVDQGSARMKRVRIIDGVEEISPTWRDRFYVKNGDKVIVRLSTNSTYNSQSISKIELDGPPLGGDVANGYGNPTEGPSVANRSFENATDTLTIKTRVKRDTPSPFKARNVYNSSTLTEGFARIAIKDFDSPALADIVVQSFGANGKFSYGDEESSDLLSIPVGTPNVDLIATSPQEDGGISSINYKIGSFFDNFRIFTKRKNYEYFSVSGDNDTYVDVNIPNYANTIYFYIEGAGGGDGGSDEGTSIGGRGGVGNFLAGKIDVTEDFLEDFGVLRLYAGEPGQDGLSKAIGSNGGNGGWGYATGGNGGKSGGADASGSGGGGGGGSAIALTNGTLLAFAGGGGGGGGGGNDTAPPDITYDQNGKAIVLQNGNYCPYDNNFGAERGNFGSLNTSTLPNLSGSDGQSQLITSKGGGGGGAGGGYGIAGLVRTERLDEFGEVIQTIDIDATGGTGGGAYHRLSYSLNNISYLTTELIDNTSFSNYGAPPRETGRVIVFWSEQNRTPVDFSIPTVSDLSINTEIESNKVQITGFTGRISVSVSGMQSKIRSCDINGNNCGEYSSNEVLIKPGQYIQILATTGSEYFKTYAVSITAGTLSRIWYISTGEPPDRYPDGFNYIPPKLNQDPSTPENINYVESDAIQINNINVPVDITATNNNTKISICTDENTCDSFQSGVRSIEGGQYFKLQLPASTSYNTSVTTGVTVGTSSLVSWEVKTYSEPNRRPDDLIFRNKSNTPLLTRVDSNRQIISGISVPINFTIDGGALINLNEEDTGLSSLEVVENDVIRLYYTTSSTAGDQKIFDITAGTYETTWTVTNTGLFGTVPNVFVFADKRGNPNEYVESNEITVSGLAENISVPLYATNGAEIKLYGTQINNSILDESSAVWVEYTLDNPANVKNGAKIKVRLLASEFPGFSVTTNVNIGGRDADYKVTTNAAIQDPILGQYYTSPAVIRYIDIDGEETQIRYPSKFEGLPIGCLMPVFKDQTEEDGWGNLNGKINSRFHGWIWCNGDYISKYEYPLLFETIGYVYGAQGIGEAPEFFRLPDFRNKKVLGTGTIDGNQPASPIVNPTFGPAKSTTQDKGGFIPGCTGGMWFIDTVGDPGISGLASENNREFEQIYTNELGDLPNESPFFSIANIVTRGYSEITELVEFEVSGYVKGVIGIDKTKIFEVPAHSHQVVMGQPDPIRNKGYISWGGKAGPAKVGSLGPPNSSAQVYEQTVLTNLWGYSTNDYNINKDNAIDVTSNSAFKGWLKSEITWTGFGGFGGQYQGTIAEEGWGSITVKQNMLDDADDSLDINRYIDTWGGNFSSYSDNKNGEKIKFIGAVDIPVTQISISPYSSAEKPAHSHYLSLIDPGSSAAIYSYGKNDGPGVAINPQFDDLTVEVQFDYDEIGMEVLPGEFVLNAGKQIIPTPGFSAQTQVPLLTPYVWVRWLIKAF
jgi:hypothetical protein